MARPRVMLWLTAGAAVLGAVVVSCTYSPDFANGSLMCSAAGECPRGYMCSTAGTCCLSGDPTCGGTIAADAGAGGDTGPHPDAHPDVPGGGGHAGTGGNTPPRFQDYVGVWTFSTTATVTTACDNPKSTSGVTSFAPGTTLTITDNGDNTLRASWTEWPDAIYTLAVDSGGAHGTDAATWYYQYTDADPMEVWFYDSFDIVLTTPAVATHDGTYRREDDWADGTAVHCSQVVHAPLTKN